MVLGEDIKDITKVLAKILHEMELARPGPNEPKGTWMHHLLHNLDIDYEIKKDLGYDCIGNTYRITKINKAKWKSCRLKIAALMKDKNKNRNITGFSRLKPDGSVEVTAYYNPKNELISVLTSESEVIIQHEIWFYP